MEKLIDLHTHSTASDGSMRPYELVRHAVNEGLTAIALTDHDTVEGIAEALEEGRKTGLEVIAGLEISVDFKPEMHILGYFFDDSYLNIRGDLADLKSGRERRNAKIVTKLNELGFDVTVEEIKAEALGGIIGRPHIAKLLMKKGYVKSIDEAFSKYLSKGAVAYFKREELSPEEGIRKIIRAGGIPVLAHPIYLDRNYDELDSLIGSLVDAGLKGIEAIYVENSRRDTENLLKIAEKHGLLVTGGSDFHGTFKPYIKIGIGRGNLKVPYTLLEQLKETAQKNPHSVGE